jgi:hypothetical protein
LCSTGAFACSDGPGYSCVGVLGAEARARCGRCLIYPRAI